MCAIFLLGGFVVAAGIARLVFLVQSIEDVTSNLDYTCKQQRRESWVKALLI